MTAPALFLERLMTDPRYPELVARVRAAQPGHVLDQADAAESEAFATLTAINDLFLVGEVQGAQAGHLPGWLRLNLLDAWVSYVSGRGETCRHSPDPGGHMPVFAAAWRPGLTACRACTHLFALGRGTAADRTCDACGRVCVGAAGDGIHPCAIQLGPMVFQYGACPDCHDPLAAGTAARPDQP